MNELKQAKTFEEQVAILKNRGFVVPDEALLIDFLQRVNYYRFSGYLYLFKGARDRYIDGTSFEKLSSIYEFDQKLRNILFEAIGEMEIEIKAKIAYHHAHKYGSLGYLDEANFNPLHNHNRFIEKIETATKNNEKLLFVKHHETNYDGRFPIWVRIEIFTLGMTSTFYADLPEDDKKAIAKQYSTTYPYLESWLHSLAISRNICAHYGRIYALPFTKAPKMPAKHSKYIGSYNPRQLFAQLYVLKCLYTNRKEDWNNSILQKITSLTQQHSEYLNFRAMGFPVLWEALLRWD